MPKARIISSTVFSVADIKALAKMDQNESPHDLPEAAKARMIANLRRHRWNEYVQPAEYQRVKSAFARQIGIPARNLFLTAGADQAIFAGFLVARRRYGARTRAMILEPTYPVFAEFARWLGIPSDRVELGYDFNIRETLFRERHTLITIVSPNNPTGDVIEPGLIRRIRKRCPRTLLLIDESYHDFSGLTHLDFALRDGNAVIVRSFSKVQLAGIRVGYGVASPEAAAAAEEMLLAPYNLNALQIAAFAAYPVLRKAIRETVAVVKNELPRFYEFFAARGIPCRESRGNFVLFRVPRARQVYEKLLRRRIKVRNVTVLPGLEDCLRVTVRSTRENDLFFRVMDSLIEK